MYLRCVIKLFYGNRSTVLFLLPLIIGVFVVINHVTPLEVPASIEHDSWWGLWIDESSIWSQILAGVFVFGNAIFINFIFNQHRFKDRNMFMPSLLYVLMHSFFHSFYYFNVHSVLSTLLLLIVYQLFQLDQNIDGRKRVFNIGFFLGLASTIYPIFIAFLIPVQICIWVFRPFIFRETILFFAGILAPLLYVIPFLMYYDLEAIQLLFDFTPIGTNSLAIMMLGALMLIFGLASLPKFFQQNSKTSIKQKKLLRIIIILMFTLLALTILEYISFSIWDLAQLILIPLIFILSFVFGEKKPETLATFVTYLLIILAITKTLLIDLSQSYL